MTTTTEHDKLAELAAGYALGVLSAEERAQFQAHVSVCGECAAEVRAFAPALTALAYAAPPQDPPVAVRDRVIASSSLRHAQDRGFAPAAASRSAVRRAPWLLAAASVALAAGLGLSLIRQRDQIGTLERRVGDAASRAETAEQQLAAARSAAADAQTVVVVLAASDLVRVELAGQPVAPRASARAFWSRSQGLVFTAANLPPLPPGRTYQLWIVTSGTPVGAGLLKPRLDGGVNAVYMTPSDITQAVALAVTIEPEGGVPAPTGDKYLVGLVN